MEKNKVKLRKKWLGGLFVVVFMAPMLLAMLLYHEDYRPTQTKQYGRLLTPPQALGDWQALVAPTPGKWRILMNTADECVEECLAKIHMMRQVHTALGKDAPRVERLWVIDDRVLWKPVAAQYPALAIVTGPWPEWLRKERGVWLVDPLGNVLMFYDGNAPEKGWLKDLKHLLKISTIG